MGIFSKLIRKSGSKPEKDDGLHIDLSKVFPRLKGLYSDETPDPNPNPGTHMQISQAESPVFDDFAKGLGVFYALDQGDRYLLLQNRHLSEKVTLEKLRAAALKNLANEVDGKTTFQGDPAGVMMLTNGGNFEAAMMLLDNIWVNVEDMVKDEICVAVPARDLMFIAGKNNPNGRESLRNVVRKFFNQEKTPGAIVRHIYAREGGKWVVVETA
jgi:uncharacterized protein YtpQ (UPF0354 family)